MIKELTSEQKEKFPEYVERWLGIGLSTDPVDREEASRAVDSVYKSAGLNPPRVKVFLDSPFGGAIGAAYLKHWNDSGDQVGVQVGDQVGVQVGRAVYGAHDANWLAFCEFFLREMGLVCCEKLAGLMDAAKCAGWFWPFENAVIITAKPQKIKMDDQKRLHCEDGPAIEYPDGWGVYAWRGVRIPQEWIKEAPPTAKEALTRQNMEQRRAACEIVGWHNILKELNAKTINKDNDPEIGELLECDIPEIGKERFLRVRCGTGRDFALPVPPEMQTALDAQAWLNFCTTDDILNLEVRT